MRSSLRLRSSAVLLLLAALSPGSSPQAQLPGFGEKIEVKLVEVDAVVTDRRGNRVYGLTAKDFEMREGRTPQQITNFSEYRAGTAPAPVVSGGVAATAVSGASLQREPHSLLVLIDSLPRTGFVRQRVFEQLEALLRKAMQLDDRAAIVLWTPGFERPTSIIETSDPAAMAYALDRLEGKAYDDQVQQSIEAQARLEADFFDVSEGMAKSQKGGPDPGAQKAFSEFVAGAMDVMRLERKVAGIQKLVTSLAARPGKKSIFYVSESFSMPASVQDRIAARDAIHKLVTACNAAGVTLYAVRPEMPDPIDQSTPRFSGAVLALEQKRALYDRSIDALRTLALPTGGTVGTGLRAVENLGARMIEDSESYYSLAYQAPTDGSDRERRISLRTTNPSYRVRMRETFVEKSNATMARDTVIARLFSAAGSQDLAFTVEESPVRRTGPDRWLLPVTVTIPTGQLRYATEKGEQVARIRVLIAAGNGLAEVTPVNEDELRVAAERKGGAGFVTYTAEVLGDGRGSKVAIGVYDVHSGFVGVRTIDNRGRFPQQAGGK